MDIKAVLAPKYVAAGRSDVNAQHIPPPLDPRMAVDPEKSTEKPLVDEIREKGFQAYAEEIAEKKKEELREKILGAMGLDEEKLASMPPELRAQIERMVSAEMLKRMSADGELNRQQNGLAEGSSVEAVRATSPAHAQVDGVGVGIGPLLALQEIDRQDDEISPKRDDRTG